MTRYFAAIRRSEAESPKTESYSSYSENPSDCCPLVVDPLLYLAFLGFIAAATYFLVPVIEMSMLMMARRRKKRQYLNYIFEGLSHNNDFH